MKQSAVSKPREALPLDARLLSDAIIELNISRRNVAIYPRGHTLVEKSLDKAFDYLRELFELRSEITVAVAKDILIVDDHFLDKKNPVFSEFALSLNMNNISSVTFMSGLSKEDIYEFQRFLSAEVPNSSKETLLEALKEYNMSNIQVEFIDFGAFSFEELREDQEVANGNLWEEYIFGLLEGSLGATEGSDVPRGVTPSILAKLTNSIDYFKDESYVGVISSYLRRSSEKSYSGSDLKKLTDYINGFRPEVKKQFLTNAINNISGVTDSAQTKLIGRSVDEVIELLRVINEQMEAIPSALKNLLNKLSLLDHGRNDSLPDKGELDPTKGELDPAKGGHVADDILVSPKIMNLISGSHFSTYVSDEYQHQIDQIIKFDAAAYRVEVPEELHKEWSDESIEGSFNQVILQLISSGVRCIIPPVDHEYFIKLLKEQAEKLVCNGSYGQILNMVNIFKAEVEENEAPGIGFYVLQHLNSQHFISYLASSFRTMDRESTADALLLCEYYGPKIVSLIIEALIEEETQRNRRFLIGLISHLGEGAYPELVKHLSDSRWFVKRNMLYMLGKCANKGIVEVVKPYAHHENSKVSSQAIKILLNVGDGYAIAVLRDLFKSKNRDSVVQAIELSGLFKVKEVVPDLVLILKKKTRTGADISNKIPIVKALGKIGGSQALDAMRGLLGAKSLLFKSRLQKLKEEIYLSLENCPAEDVRDILQNN